MEEEIMISKDTSLIQNGVWVNGIKITTSEDWNKVVEESIPKQAIRDKIEFYKRYGKVQNSDEYVMSVEIDILEELLKEE